MSDTFTIRGTAGKGFTGRRGFDPAAGLAEIILEGPAGERAVVVPDYRLGIWRVLAADGSTDCGAIALPAAIALAEHVAIERR